MNRSVQSGLEVQRPSMLIELVKTYQVSSQVEVEAHHQKLLRASLEYGRGCSRQPVHN